MAKSPLKRPAAKPASKKPLPAVTASRSKAAVAGKANGRPVARPPTGRLAAKSASTPANGKAAALKSAVAKRTSATMPVKPAVRLAAAAVNTKLDGANKLPLNGRASIRAGVAKTTINGKSASAIAANNVADGSKPANGKHVNGKTNGTPAVVDAPKVPGRPMLMQGPVASKALSKKGTFVLPKTPALAPKPVKRKIERPEPAFVTLQPPVAQVRTSEKAVKNRAGLGQRDLDFFRDLLLAKRRELVGDMSHMEREALRESNASINSVPVDPTDQGTDAYEQEFTLGLVEKDRTLLREINDAMAKLQNGTYGICEGTGNPISRPRLEAQPWARHSIEFARILEKRKMVFRR